MPLLISNLVGLFLLMAVGALAVRLKVVPLSITGQLSHLLMSVMTPAIIFRSMLQPFSQEFLRDSAVIFAAGCGLYLLSIGAALVLGKVFRVTPGRRGLWALCVAFPNNGFMGFPIIQALLGDTALALAAIMGMPFNIFLYTLGVRVLLSDREGESGGGVSLRKILLTPVNVATVLGLAAFLLQIPVPDAIYTPISYLADMATPMSMLIIGMGLTRCSASQVVRDRDVLAAGLSKLVLLPLLVFLALKVIPFGNELIAPVVLITVAMPTAAIVSALGEQHGLNTDLAVEISFLTGLLCILTVPLMLSLPL
ncbi:AEC family transporter [Dysosmobacter sp.]|uniref:AEC family transporter n=1 Tax=Dysosmobacter sp. TaxID=2591382 RepID=UPI002D809B04|nr:AEC family transporter [Dysosmobacter sp.]